MSIPIHKRLFIIPKTLAETALLAAEDKTTVGGQALIEGVLMRGPQKVAWAVRKPSGEVVVESHPFLSITKRVKVLGVPLIRGVVGLFESMSIGYRALARSADLAMENAECGMQNAECRMENAELTSTAKDAETSSLGDKVMIALTMLVALGVSVGLFMLLPMWVAGLVFNVDPAVIKELQQNADVFGDSATLQTVTMFNLTAGAVRIVLLLIYMFVISLWKDTRRLFEYHGAEHKTIKAYEDGKPLTFEEIDKYTTIHPRCGTSFLVLVAIVGILMSSVIDVLYYSYIGAYAGPLGGLFNRFAVRLLFIPLLAGVSYEALKLSAKYAHIPIVNFLVLPGLLVQRITTKKPDESQVETAVKALEAAV